MHKRIIRKVFLVPSTATFDSSSNPSGTQLVGPNALTGGGGNYNSSTAAWNTENIVFAAVPGQAYKLVFVFKSDFSTTTGVPAAIDNVSLTSSVPGTFISVVSGNWNSPSTWQANAVPTVIDSAVVSAGHTVSVNATNLGIGSVLVDGILNYTSTPTSFKVNKNLHISAGGQVQVFSGTTGKTLDVVGNIYNDGNLDVSVGATTAGILTLSGSSTQTVSGSGNFGTKIRNLNITNTSGAFPSINWLVNNVVVEYNLTITNQKINLNGNTLQYGNATTVGNTFSFTNGGFYNGTFSRWWAASTTGYTTTTAITSTPTTAPGRYPFINSLGEERVFYLGRTSGSGSGTYDVTYFDANTITSGLNIVDGALTITNRWDGHFKVDTTGAPSGATFQVSIFAPNAMFVSSAPNILHQNAAMSGTQLTGFSNLGTRRNLITTADLLNPTGIFIGVNQSAIINIPIASGDWNNPANWLNGTVPTCTDVISIPSGITLTVNSASNVLKSLTINSGATLIINSGDLTVGCTDNNTTFVNNGTLTVNGGTLTVNGQMTHNSGSTFNQSGGEIFIDPNSGTVATSLAANTLVLNTNNLNWTGGRITIVDPSPSTSSYYSINYVNGNNVNLTSGTHTVRLGDGISTQAGGNSNGFYLNTYSSSGRLLFRNLEVDALNGTNRHVSTIYTFGVDSNLTIHTNSDVRLATLYVGGNIVNNGIFKSTTALYLSKYIGGTVSNTPYPQVISGTGTFQNVTTGTATANLSSLYINNSSTAGVTLQVPLSVSNILDFKSGIVHTSPTSILKLGTTTATGTLTGGSATAYVDGPFQVTFANGNTNEKFIPLGTATEYAPLYLTLATSGISVVQTQAINDPSGTFPASLGAISNIKWNIEGVSGSITSYLPKVAHAGITSLSKLLSSTSVGGFYDNTVIGTNASYVGGTLPSLAPFSAILNANFQSYLTYGFPVNCSGVPTPGSLNLSDPEICSNKQTTISISPIDGKMGYSYEWESSVDNITYTTIASAIDTILNVFPTGQYIRAKITCQFEPTPGYSAPIKLDNSFIVNPIADIVKCGPGPVTLTATGNSGSIFWFESAANTVVTQTGSPYTFNVNNDTTLYVRAGAVTNASTVLGLGDVIASSSYATSNVFYGLYGSFKSQNIILASELSAAGLNSGDAINSLSYHTTGVAASPNYPNFNLKLGHTTQNAVTTSFISSSSLTSVYRGTLTLTANTANVLNFGTGAPNNNFIWDGVSNIVVESSWTTVSSSGPTCSLKVNTTPFNSTTYFRDDNLQEVNLLAANTGSGIVSYRPMMTLGYSKSCFSTVEDVNVDVTASPALTINKSIDTICVGSSSVVNLTSNVADYDSYTWNNSATGDELSGWTLTPSNTTTYTLTASQSSGSMCTSLATVLVNVDETIPSNPTTSQANFDICEGTTTNILTANGTHVDSVVISSNTLNLPINSSNAIQNTSLVISGIPTGANITELSVKLNMTHTYLEDMQLTLNAPNGNGVIIFDEEGGSSDNLVNTIISSNGTTNVSLGTGPFTGVYAPSYSMAPLMTGNLNGTWTLKLQDNYPSSDDGTFQNWSIKIKYSLTSPITWYDAPTNGNILGTGNSYESIGNSVISSPATIGNYSFYAIASQGKCKSAPLVIDVDVHSIPTVVAGADLNVCSSDLVTLTAFGNAATYTWNNGVVDGTAFLPSAGNYVVTGVSAVGCTAKDSLTISTLPAPVVTAGANVTECYGTQVAFNASGNASSYTWNNGVIDGQAFSLINAGYYVVTGMGSNGCSAKDSLLATVHALPVVDAGADVAVCEGGSVTLSGSGANTYTWDNGVTDGVSFVPTVSGTYEVSGTDANGCSNTDQVDVTVNALPLVDAGADVAVCEGGSITLSASGADTYTWDNGVTDGVSFVPTASGTYEVTGMDANGCSNTDQVDVTVNALPVVDAGADVAVCEGGSVTLSAAGADTYTWDNGVTDGVSFVPTASGTFEVTGTDANGCINTDQITVTVNPLPVIDLGADIVTTNNTYVLDATSAFTTYAWSTGETTQTITVSQNGSYSVVVTDANGCSGTDTISFVTTFSVENVDGSNGNVIVFPNPTRDIVNLQFNGVKASDVKIDVVSMSGAVIATSKASLVEGNGVVVLNLGNVAEGVYLVRMSYNNSVTTHRIIVKK